ncbi:hypothetical protein ACOQFV_03690 [Nocardiopsis changdeensis]|uniref:Small secreted hydrophilic protein n=1 Tax=Nocardiopsis changdeensis TaxID=2831969 RepID=A0ABX8BKE1_9ACTN|nr:MULTISPECIES: hypothetical protein [Nocardiopsis]QUX22712.1 hypothetical protein KGD84_31265 [Nocardiopsis changdeensis]QYX38655.1 hypothetical protein K1J57_08640 [Nocardiopsis sp. MT53]
MRSPWVLPAAVAAVAAVLLGGAGLAWNLSSGDADPVPPGEVVVGESPGAVPEAEVSAGGDNVVPPPPPVTDREEPSETSAPPSEEPSPTPSPTACVGDDDDGCDDDDDGDDDDD